MNNIHIMVDMETLETKTHTSILQLYAQAFQLNGEKLASYEAFIDISKTPDLQVSEGTLAFWRRTNPTLFTQLINKGMTEGISEKEAVQSFMLFARQLEADYGAEAILWGNGIANDNTWLKVLCEKYDIPYAFSYNRDRDLRTVVDIAVLKSGMTQDELHSHIPPNNDPHNAKADTHYQIDFLCYLMNQITN